MTKAEGLSRPSAFAVPAKLAGLSHGDLGVDRVGIPVQVLGNETDDVVALSGVKLHPREWLVPEGEGRPRLVRGAGHGAVGVHVHPLLVDGERIAWRWCDLVRRPAVAGPGEAYNLGKLVTLEVQLRVPLFARLGKRIYLRGLFHQPQPGTGTRPR